MRKNLFSNLFNSLLTLLIVLFLFKTVPPFIRWAFVNSTWWSDGATCNLAGGACWSGKSSAERASHHRIARGSAMECGAAVDIIRLLRVAEPEDLARARELVERVVSMLTKMGT